MNTDTREKATTCGCCGGRIPAGLISWSEGGECPGHIDGDNGNCGAIESVMTVKDLWLDAKQGLDKNDYAFGFIGTDETYEDDDGDDVTYCGWFFTWPGTRATIMSEAERQAVIDSLETDETERHNEAIPLFLAVEKLTAYLAKKFPTNLDAEE